MALNEAYGQTDVMNDPRYLMTLAQSGGRQGKFARERLRELQEQRQFETGHAQQASQFREAHAQQERQRQDALAEGARRHDETLGQQRLSQQQLDAYRQAQLSQTEEGRRQQRALGLLNLAQSNLELTHGANTPAIRKALYDQFYNETMGGGQPQVAPAPTGQPQTTTPAPSGLSGLAPQTTDPKAAAVAGFQAGQGETVTPTAPAQGTQPQAAGGQQTTFAPSSLYDINKNTAEYVPHNTEGTINGQPAGQLLAQMAAAHGRTPESASGQAAYRGAVAEAGNRQIGEATTPPIDITAPAPPRMGGNQPHTAMDFGEITAPQQPQTPQTPAPAPVAPAAAGPVNPEQIPTNPAGEPQYPSGAMSSGLHSGAWLAEQFKQLPVGFNPAGHPGEDYQAAEQRRRLQTTGY